jgi:hypothetical protein
MCRMMQLRQTCPTVSATSTTRTDGIEERASSARVLTGLRGNEAKLADSGASRQRRESA